MAVALTGSVSRGAVRSPWVVSALTDGLVIIGGPLLIVPILLLLSQFLEPIVLAGFVLGAMSTGHHLPGFVRAYGDPVLFARYRLRFLVAPPLLFACIFWFTWNGLQGAVWVVAVWGIWHGLMQIYGFMRIYDAKRGENSPLTARLDWLMCVTGWVAVLLWSPGASLRIIDAAEASGLFFFALLFGDTAQQLATAVAGAMALVYVGYTGWKIWSGQPVAPLKLILLASSTLFLYLSWVMAGSAVLLGLAAWEAFHDAQYLAIAWASNRRLGEKKAAGSLIARLYQPRLGLLAIYIATCIAYGLFANAQGFGAGRIVAALLVTLVLTSALLHFYYDGFIWKVRQARTRDDLGLPSIAGNGVTGATGSRDAGHLALLLGLLGVLAACGIYRDEFEIPMRSEIVRWMPDASHQQLKLAAAYFERERFEEAEVTYRELLRSDDSLAIAHHNLGMVLVRRGRDDEAIESYRRALIRDPELRDSSLALTPLLVFYGHEVEAQTVARAALEHDPDSPKIQSALASALLAGSPSPSQIDEAVALARRAAEQTGFGVANPLIALAEGRAAEQRFDLAVRLLERAKVLDAVRRNPKLAGRIDRDLERYRALLPAGG